MSGPTNYSSDGQELFTEAKPAIVQIADLLDVVGEIRDIYDETLQTQQEVVALKDDYTIYNDQTNFVDLISKHVDYDQMMIKKENSLGWLTVMVMKNDNHLSWTFRNNAYDDYWILGDCFTGKVSIAPVIYENKNYGTTTGTWVTTAPNAHYTTSVGATMTTTVTGENIEFHFYSDNRGGIWEFVIDGDNINKVTVSTFSANATPTNIVTLKTGLTFGEHTVVGTFKGDDPSNAPSSGVGTSRGWVYVNGSNNFLTFRTFKSQYVNNRENDLLVGFSNKEFAIKIRKKGMSNYQFVPMHSNIGTAFNMSPPEFLVDGNNKDFSTSPIGEFMKCSSFTLSQKVYGRNPDSGSENLLEIYSDVSINKKGLAQISGKIKALTDVEVLDGYFIMVPASKPVVDRLTTSINFNYPCIKTDGSKTYLTLEKDKANSYAFVSSTTPDFVIAYKYDDPKNTLRPSQAGKYPPDFNTWLEHRDTNMTKFYASAFYNTTIMSGSTHRFSGSIMPAKIKNIGLTL